jgi:peptidoglycan/LPS O-acetylase OafA/YrhL
LIRSDGKGGGVAEVTVASAVDGEKVAESHGGAGYFQVDAMKAVMIFLVVFDHTVPWIIKDKLGYVLWERISIPMFMVIMGFNMALSFKRKGDVSLRELYSKNYFKRKFLRFLIPFLVLYVASTIIGLIIYNFDFHALIDNQLLAQWDLPYLLIGILPFWGPGNWFIPLLFQCVLVLPIIYKAFSKKPVLTLILCFAGEIACWLLATSFLDWTIMLLFLVSIPAYLSAIGLGMWFSSGHNLTDRRNWFMWILFSLSTIYMIAYQFFDFRFKFVRGDYNYLFYPYSAFIFLIAMKLLPKKSESEFTKAITWIGKATYHILLTQILYLGIVFAMWGGLSYMYTASVFGIGLEGGTSGLTHLLINWMICIPVGVLWWFMETKTVQNLSGVQYQKGASVDMRSWWESFRYGVDPIIREAKFVLHRMKGNFFSLIGIIIIMFFAVVALIAPVIAPSTPNNCWRGDPYKMKIREDWKGSSWIDPPPTPPSPEHPFGTVV